MSKGKKNVTLQFVSDEDVGFCGNLSTKTPFIKPKKRHTKTIIEVDDDLSKKSNSGQSSKSNHKSHPSTHFIESPISKRRSKTLLTTEAIVQPTETNKGKIGLLSQEKRRRLSKAEKSLFDDNCEIKENQNDSESGEFNAKTRTSRRSSKRIQSLMENKSIAESNPLFTESPRQKRHILRSHSKIFNNQPKKNYCEISRNSATDVSSSSEPEEMSSKISSSAYNTQAEFKKTNSNSTITAEHKTLQQSESKNKSTGFSTPTSSRLSDGKHLRTPATVRRKLTKKFAAISRKIESDDESSSMNELEQSSDECFFSSSELDSSEDEDSDSNDMTASIQPMPSQERMSKSNNLSGRKNTIDADLPYKVDADGYFLSKCSKEPTSNNQLSSLEVSHLEEDEINNLLRNEYTKHGSVADSLVQKYKNEFTRWLFYLKENFSLLMYGLGSKIELLQSFHSEILSMHDVLTIHGYFPRLFVKDILNSLIVDVLKINAPKNVNEALPVIKSTLQCRKSPVFVIIHSIDRLICRQRKQQSVISKLASFPNLHMIVSIDHINAPLIWGNSMLTELNFVWVNITTYQPYVNETSFENLIYLNEAGTDFVSLSSLRNIFKPLAPRVKKIFQIIAKERLENANNRYYKGMPYDEWYHRAKENLLVNNSTVFKVQLTELIDHGIIKINDHQCIPILIKLDVLEKFYKEMYSSEEE